ncbi:hypothetical protein QR680_019082 [Steinernema hermaphroditum]|uniref:Nanos-type domain-containing protein n=1 Tax=Steinernema hermaphroditum TaxID=289476 RepID=A0AA39HM65_9BILA|nr:hypothetical protein QR680_019082 [Steinernema hermaphroditum]
MMHPSTSTPPEAIVELPIPMRSRRMISVPKEVHKPRQTRRPSFSEIVRREPMLQHPTQQVDRKTAETESRRLRSHTLCMRSLTALLSVYEAEETGRLRSMSETQPVNEFSCGFCKARGMGDHIGHTNKNCPELARMRPCMKCGARGFDNHTLKYCPRNGVKQNHMATKFEIDVQNNDNGWGPMGAAEKQLSASTDLFNQGMFQSFTRLSGIGQLMPNNKQAAVHVVDWLSTRAERLRREGKKNPEDGEEQGASDGDFDFTMVFDKKQMDSHEYGQFRPRTHFWAVHAHRDQQKTLQNAKLRRSIQKELNKRKKIQQRYKRF